MCGYARPNSAQPCRHSAVADHDRDGRDQPEPDNRTNRGTDLHASVNAEGTANDSPHAHLHANTRANTDTTCQREPDPHLGADRTAYADGRCARSTRSLPDDDRPAFRRL